MVEPGPSARTVTQDMGPASSEGRPLRPVDSHTVAEQKGTRFRGPQTRTYPHGRYHHTFIRRVIITNDTICGAWTTNPHNSRNFMQL